jgi:predicted glycoside hydrolase/deacetylase ChbG (UPF0249 family)
MSITLELMRKYHIQAVRLPREKINLKITLSGISISRVIQLIGLNYLCSKVKDKSILHTNHFTGFLYAGQLNRRYLERLIDHFPQNGTCELICHPGLDNQNTHYNHWQYHWSEELSVLTDPYISNLIQQKGFQLISYQDLAHK